MTEIPVTMRGVVLTGHGDFSKLEFRSDIPVPKPASNEVLVQVAAAGVNNTDINTRIGWYSKQEDASDEAGWTGAAFQFPRIQGADVCGHIVAVGTEVDAARIGERILIEPCLREVKGEALENPWYYGSECDGGFADYTVVASRHACKIESDLTDAELASFPCSYSTAENLLTRTTVTKGDRVLVTGASGGVGSAVIQLAQARGATVIAVTSPAKFDAIKRLGADQIFARDEKITDALGFNSVDVVIDLVGGDQWPDLLDILRPGGRYGVSGAIGGAIVDLDLRTLYLKDLSFFGCTVLEPTVFKNLITLIETGHVMPLVAETYSLEKIVDAQTAFLTKKHTGKIVLEVNS
ncbi:MAG: alcohol dehydrogenase family protein [Sneathiella sp.]